MKHLEAKKSFSHTGVDVVKMYETMQGTREDEANLQNGEDW